MEFPEVGLKCDDPACKQLDFLPIICNCKKTFCSEHFQIHSAECRIDNRVQELKQIEAYDCANPDCEIRSVIPITCEKCGKHMCITHRHTTECGAPSAEERHTMLKKMQAPILEIEKQKELIDQQLNETLANAKKKQKNIEMANKVQLMRLKNKATGAKSIPSTDRIYFNIIVPSAKTTIPVFVSTRWSLGRAVDAITDECKIRNNQQTALQLRLLNVPDKVIISSNFSETMESLVKNKIIIDGQDLILEYVNI